MKIGLAPANLQWVANGEDFVLALAFTNPPEKAVALEFQLDRQEAAALAASLNDFLFGKKGHLLLPLQLKRSNGES